MKRLVYLTMVAAFVLMTSCGGGGGNSGQDPLAQPTAFFPDGVETIDIFFHGLSTKEFPEQITLTQSVETTTEDSKATVTSGEFSISDGPNTKYISLELTGTVQITRLSGQQGYMLAWDGSSADDGHATLKGAMQMRFTMVNDTDGQRHAMVSSSQMILEYAGGKKQKDYARVLDGTTVEMKFSAGMGEDGKEE